MESRLGVGALPCTEAERRLGRHRLVANHYLSWTPNVRAVDMCVARSIKGWMQIRVDLDCNLGWFLPSVMKRNNLETSKRGQRKQNDLRKGVHKSAAAHRHCDRGRGCHLFWGRCGIRSRVLTRHLYRRFFEWVRISFIHSVTKTKKSKKYITTTTKHHTHGSVPCSYWRAP